MPAAVAVPLIVAGASAGASAYAANRQSNAAAEGARLQTNSADLGARLQSRASADQLRFLQAQDARQNAQYLDEQRYNRQQAADELARREPFRQFSLGTLSQLSRPLNQRRPAGSLGEVVR